MNMECLCVSCPGETLKRINESEMYDNVNRLVHSE